MINPDFSREHTLINQGFSLVAGLDEVGRGCWAGPVVAGAAIIPAAASTRLTGVRDSKTLSAKQREQAATVIREHAIWSVGEASPSEIDSLGIGKATRLAMVRAVEALPHAPEYLLIDGRESLGLPLPEQAIVDGDALCLSIAAASIIAKVYRDALMTRLDAQYPGYGFGQHVGYGTKQHMAALTALGRSPMHRLSFKPVMRYTPAKDH